METHFEKGKIPVRHCTANLLSEAYPAKLSIDPSPPLRLYRYWCQICSFYHQAKIFYLDVEKIVCTLVQALEQMKMKDPPSKSDEENCSVRYRIEPSGTGTRNPGVRQSCGSGSGSVRIRNFYLPGSGSGSGSEIS